MLKKVITDRYVILYAIATVIFTMHVICCDKIPAKDPDALAQDLALACKNVAKATEATCALTGKACSDAGDAGVDQ